MLEEIAQWPAVIVLITICSCSSVEPAKEKTTAHKTTQNLNTTIIDQQIILTVEEGSSANYKIKEQLAGVAALIGVLGAIGAGFIKYGEVMSKLDSLEAFNPDPMMQVIGDNKQDIAVLEKTIQVLELEIQELKESSKNPLTN